MDSSGDSGPLAACLPGPSLSLRQGGVEPSAVVDVVDKLGKVLGDFLEGFEGHRVDGLDLARGHVDQHDEAGRALDQCPDGARPLGA